MTSPFTYHDAKVALEALAMFRAGECPSPTQADSALGKLHLTPGTSMVQVSRFEAKAALDAISQMTDGNARDFVEWRKQTHGTRAQWQALLRIESKLLATLA